MHNSPTPEKTPEHSPAGEYSQASHCWLQQSYGLTAVSKYEQWVMFLHSLFVFQKQSFHIYIFKILFWYLVLY